MATDHDTRLPPRDARDPRTTSNPAKGNPARSNPTGAAGPQVARDSQVHDEPATSSRSSTHHGAPKTKDNGYGRIALIVGGLVVAAVVLFLLFSGGTSDNQTAPTTAPASTAPATGGTAPADTGTGTGTDTGTGTGTAPADGSAPATGGTAPLD